MKKTLLTNGTKFKRLSIKEFENDLPDFKNLPKPKTLAIAKWIIDKIENDGNINFGDLLPQKNEFAYLLGVSAGTVQKAFLFLEDFGYVESKQCVGTLIKNPKDENAVMFRKQTSKRDVTINLIKKYIIDNELKPGCYIPSPAKISQIVDKSLNMTRLALEHLCVSGILEHKFKCEEKSGWILKSLDFTVEEFKRETLVEKVAQDLKIYISQNCKVGDRIPSHGELMKIFSASMKTVNDAYDILLKEGIILPRRGSYGTYVVKMPFENGSSSKENSIFAPSAQTAVYYYEKVQENIKKMISQNYEVGQKLPPINKLAEHFDVSPSIVRKAFKNLSDEGYLAFSRGRSGGTFVLDIPDEQSFKWLSVNPQYAKVFDNN